MEWPCLREHPEGCLLQVRLLPNASRSALEGLREGRLTARVQAPPVEGKANQALCRVVADALGLRPADVILLRGERSRQKDLLLRGMNLDLARARLSAVARDA
ncbi:MAG TPA: DUF167 family protein [Candidatus Sumerlaeota bacterium]|nr:DUF167 family protein [Candidatus Sumerlaeota bacterium]HPK01868.1 DUF167 family protein [Candidatus Sumerlaeota bacterium]